MSRPVISMMIMCGLVYFAPVAQAQTVRGQLPVLTRLVQQYAGLERQLIDAINRRDRGVIDRLLAPDFEMRTAAHPGTPTPRAEWMAQMLKGPKLSVAIDQIAVHDHGPVRIVSFVTTTREHTDDDRNSEIMVVDVWLQSGETSLLKTRYAAVRPKQPTHIPGDAPPKPFEKRF